LDSLENVKISGVVYIDVEDEVLISRLLGRQVCLSCGAIYHKLNSPSKISGKCDKCHGDLVTRSDDEQEKIKTRLEIFGKETTPVLSHYKNKGIYFRVDGNCSPEKVYEQVKAIIQSKI
jgi:adenylate kinase